MQRPIFSLILVLGFALTACGGGGGSASPHVSATTSPSAAPASPSPAATVALAGIVTTFAGNGTSPGYQNGPAASAEFTLPTSVAIDPSGNVYVADEGNCAIRKITPTGTVSTLAGGSAPCINSPFYLDGTGSTVGFYFPLGLTVDSSGNVYVADTWNNAIREVSPSGVVTTIAGLNCTPNSSPGCTPGSQDGTTATAAFSHPIGIHLDANHNLYVADAGNNQIRKIAISGVVTTIAGNGTAGYQDGAAGMAEFNYPEDIALDASGNIYVTDANNHRIRKVSASGTVTTVAGTGAAGYQDGPGNTAMFHYPFGIAVDPSGTLYVGDTFNNRIREISPTGVVTTLAGSTMGYQNGIGSAAEFNYPDGVLFWNGDLYVADSGNGSIRLIR